MRIKSLTISGIALAMVAGAGFIGYRLGTNSLPGVNAQSTPSGQFIATSGGSGSSRDSYADVVDRVAPAVVTIRSARRVRAPQQYPFMDDSLLRQFFGDRGGQMPQREAPPRMQRGLGSGVIVTGDGYILTNHHVIDGAEQISVEMIDRRSFDAKLIGSDAPSDLALLKIEASGLAVLSLGDSDKVRVGDVVMAVGNPLGIGETVTAGIISARGRSTGLSDGSFEDFLQTDAAINQGNSGGALINTRGELIGINSQIVSPSGGNIGIGFAIPSNMANNVLNQLKKGGKVRRGKLGIGIQEITSDLAKGLGLRDVRGVLVNGVDPGSPAAHAGIRIGDAITAVNGIRVDNANSLRNQIAASQPGTETTITLLREGKEQQVKAKLGEMVPDKEVAGAAAEPGSSRQQLGISVQPLTADAASRLGLRPDTQGVVVAEVDPSGPAAEAGLKAGDVITEVNRQPVKSAAELKSSLDRNGSGPVVLLVNRGGRSLFLSVQRR